MDFGICIILFLCVPYLMLSIASFIGQKQAEEMFKRYKEEEERGNEKRAK